MATVEEKENAVANLIKALENIAAFDDMLGSDRLATNGSYGGFDEPGSVKIAREALAIYRNIK
jgi:hypothetical protein